MAGYIDGFAFPIPRPQLQDYKQLAEQIADIWKEHGALSYVEYVGDDMSLEGTRSFIDALDVKADEVAVFGWVMFESRQARDEANEKVASDPRMTQMMSNASVGFDSERMAYGGFTPLIQK